MIRLTELELDKAHEAYGLFYESFIKDDTPHYVEFSNFIHKTFGDPYRLEEPYCFVEIDGTPSVMIANIGMPILYGGNETVISHTADFASNDAGHGLPAVKCILKNRDHLASQGIPFRIGASVKKVRDMGARLGYVTLGWFDQYSCSNPDRGPLDTWRSHTLNGMDSFSVNRSCDTSIFSEEDYVLINRPQDLVKTKKSAAINAWRIDGLEGRAFVCVKICHYDKICAYSICERKGRTMRLIDWDIIDDETEERDRFAHDCMATMLVESYRALDTPDAHHCKDINRIHVSHLNPALGETSLFEGLGFSLYRNKDGEPVGNCLGFASSAGNHDQVFEDFDRWRLREADRDYFLNCNPEQ